MAIGYIGLGNMGGPLARRLQLSHPLFVFDPNPAALAACVEKGATACSSAQDLASKCDIVFLCLPTSDFVRKVIFGDKGVLAGCKPGTMIVDQTTGDPTATRAMAKELLAKNIDMIDAPVSGGASGANAGTIAVMVGASPEQFKKIEPVLKSISPNIFHAGGIGNGNVIKLVNNMMSGIQRLVTFEGIALAMKNGVDPQIAVDILNASGGRNSFSERIMGKRIIKGKLGVGFTLALMHKDVRLACQLGTDSGVPLMWGNFAREFYQACINEFGSEEQVDVSALVVDRMSGTKVVPKDHTLEVTP